MRLKRALLVLSLVIGGSFFLGGDAHALRISPTILDDLVVDPGDVVQFELMIENETEKDKIISFSSQNFVSDGGEAGSPKFIDESEEGDLPRSSNLASWIAVFYDSIELPSGAQRSVTVAIKIPEDAEPGSHQAVVWAGEKNGPQDVSVGLRANVGLLVLLNVTGDVVESVNVKEFNYLKKFQNRLPVDFYARLSNEGSVYFKPKGDVIIKGLFGNKVGKIPFNPRRSNILPKSIRRIEGIVWEKTPDLRDKAGFFGEIKNEWKNFGFGPYKAELDVKYSSDGKKLEGKTSYFWVLPWHLILVTLVLLIALFFLMKGYNRLVIKRVEKKRTKSDGKNKTKS